MPARGNHHDAILRMYWDDWQVPSVEVPVGVFFAGAYTSFDAYLMYCFVSGGGSGGARRRCGTGARR
ncbi:MAG: DUF2961 domain-containing protein [Candidatus Nanopelagicales bacterium]